MAAGCQAATAGLPAGTCWVGQQHDTPAAASGMACMLHGQALAAATHLAQVAVAGDGEGSKRRGARTQGARQLTVASHGQGAQCGCAQVGCTRHLQAGDELGWQQGGSVLHACMHTQAGHCPAWAGTWLQAHLRLSSRRCTAARSDVVATHQLTSAAGKAATQHSTAAAAGGVGSLLGSAPSGR